MSEYLRPDVYVEDIPNAPVIEQVSSSTGAFMGVAQRGKVGVPTFITSWNSYLTNFASGMESPFIANSDLAYAVYGFFQNGGQRCYVMRVAGDSAKVALGTDEEVILQAKDEGAWGNKLSVMITKNELDVSKFDITVSLGGTVVEVISEVDNNADGYNYWVDVVNAQSLFIEAFSGDIYETYEQVEKVQEPIPAPINFEGGVDSLEDITDNAYIKLLANFDEVEDFTLLAIPGQTSKVIYDAAMSYCQNRKYLFYIIDAPRASTVTSVKELRKQLSCANSALYFPYIKVNDPLSKVGKLRECPPSGHVMGVYARTIQNRGVWKAPAGTEAVVRGAIEVVTKITNGDLDVLNPMYINSLVPKANAGIVIWGARALNPDSSMKYVGDMLLDITIKKSVYNGTQQFVFEPNSHETWTKVETSIQAFLNLMWLDGALFGEKPEEAYYVKCDETLNTEAVRNAGRMICEVGYASKKPAEFVIFRFSHTVAEQ